MTEAQAIEIITLLNQLFLCGRELVIGLFVLIGLLVFLVYVKGIERS